MKIIEIFINECNYILIGNNNINIFDMYYNNSETVFQPLVIKSCGMTNYQYKSYSTTSISFYKTDDYQ